MSQHSTPRGVHQFGVAFAAVISLFGQRAFAQSTEAQSLPAITIGTSTPRAAPDPERRMRIANVVMVAGGVSGAVSSLIAGTLVLNLMASDPRWETYHPDIQDGAAVCAFARTDPSPDAAFIRDTCTRAAITNVAMWAVAGVSLAAAVTGGGYLVSRFVARSRRAGANATRVAVVPVWSTSFQGLAASLSF